MPGHADPGPSLKIRWFPQVGNAGGGGTVLHCHGCGSSASGRDLAEALGLEFGDLFDDPLPKRDWTRPRTSRTANQRKAGMRRKKQGKLPKPLVLPTKPATAAPQGRHRWQKARVYSYPDADGNPIQQSIRKECSCDLEPGTHKTFSQRYYVDGDWVSKAPDAFVPVLFRLREVLDQIAAGGVVWLVEGEKDVETAEHCGLVATTNVNGGTAFTDVYAETLRGAVVYVVLDRDKAGYQRGVAIHSVLDEMAAEVKFFLPATVEDKSDLTDHVEAGFDIDALVPVHIDELRVWAITSQIPDHTAAVTHAAVNSAAYRERSEEPACEDQDADLAAARRWATEAEVKFETVRARMEDAHALLVRTGTEWAAEALERNSGQVDHARQQVAQAHEALGLPLPATVGDIQPQRSGDDQPADEEDKGAGGADEHPDDIQAGRDERASERRARRAELVEPDENDTNYRILNGRLVQYKRRQTQDGGVDYSAEPILSVAVQVIQRELAEPEENLDEDVELLLGRSGRDRDDLNPPPAPKPLAWTIQYVDPASGELMRQRVDDDTFEKMTWLDGLPGPPDFNRSTTGRKTVQSAIFAVSPPVQDVIRYRSTGWRRTSDGWIFVHAGGAIGADGYRPAPVLLSGALSRFDLPDPVTDPAQLRKAFFEASGAMMSALPRRAVAPLLGHVWRSGIKRIPGVCVLTGSPGSYKTALAALTMHHWGELWTNQRPATSGGGKGDTSNAMRSKLHRANHVLFWDDDFAPTDGVEAGIRRLGEFIKMVSNAEERERSTRDGQDLLSGSRPRASGLATSELPPRPGGESRRAMRVPMLADEVDFDSILALDRPERRHQRALLMASFLRWLAADLDTYREAAQVATEEYRDGLIRLGHEKELSATVACERSGWVLMLRFLTEIGAINADEQQTMLEDSDTGLQEAVAAAIDPDLATTTARKVHEMLVHALRTGAAYVEDVRTGEAPPWPLAAELGWQRFPLGYDHVQDEQRWRIEKRHAAIHLGYVLHDPNGRDGVAAVYADKDALDQTLTMIAKTLADAQQVDIGTVLRALRDEGLLITEQEEGRMRLTIKRQVQCLGRRRRFAVLRLDRLLVEEPDDEDPGHDGDGGHEDPDPWQPTDLFSPAAAADSDVGDGSNTGDARHEGLTTPQTEETMTNENRAPVELTNRAGHTAVYQSTPDGKTSPCQVCGRGTSAMFDGMPMHVICFKQSSYGGKTTPVTPAVQATERPAADSVSPVKAPTTNNATTRPAAASSAKPIAAVVADVDGVWLPDGKRIDLPEPMTHAGHLAQIGYDLKLHTQVTSWWKERGQVWVTGALLEKLGVPIDPAALDALAEKRRTEILELTAGTTFVDDAIADGWSIGGTGEALGPWTRMWREDSTELGVFLTLIPTLVTDDERTALPFLVDDPDAATLAKRVALLASKLGTPYSVSPGATGIDLMSTLTRKRSKELKDRPNPAELLILRDPPLPIQQRNQEQDFNWFREPSEDEQQLSWVVGYDRGGSYLGVLGNLELGIGQPIHQADGAAFHKDMPGYWSFLLPEASDWRIPHPLWPTMKMPAPDWPTWATTPTLAYAMELGYQVEILEAWVWPEHARILETWQKMLRDARADLDIGDIDHQLARDVVKMIYSRTVGLMGSDVYLAGNDGYKDGYRPDWRHHIIAKSRANILRAVRKIGTSKGVWPLALSTDTVYYASNEPDPLKAWPGEPSQLGRGLGKYNPEVFLPMSVFLDKLHSQRRSDRFEIADQFEKTDVTLQPQSVDAA